MPFPDSPITANENIQIDHASINERGLPDNRKATTSITHMPTSDGVVSNHTLIKIEHDNSQIVLQQHLSSPATVLPETIPLLRHDSEQLEVRLGKQAPQTVDGKSLSQSDTQRLHKAFTTGIRGLARQDTIELTGPTRFERITYKVARDPTADTEQSHDFEVTLILNKENRVHSCLVVDVATGESTQARFVGQKQGKRNAEDSPDRATKRLCMESSQPSSSSAATASTSAAAWPGPDGFDSDQDVISQFAKQCQQDYYGTPQGQQARTRGMVEVGFVQAAWIDVADHFHAWQAERTFQVTVGQSTMEVHGLRALGKCGFNERERIISEFQLYNSSYSQAVHSSGLHRLFNFMDTGEMTTQRAHEGTGKLELHPMHKVWLNRYCDTRGISNQSHSPNQIHTMVAIINLLDEIRKRESNFNGNPIALPGLDGKPYSRMDPLDLYRSDPQAFNDVAANFPEAADYVDWIRNGAK